MREADEGRRTGIALWERALVAALLRLGRTPWGASGAGRAHGLLRLFPWIEGRLQSGHDIRPLHPRGYLRFEVAPLPARPLPLEGEPPVRHGEPVVILHLNNAAVTSQVVGMQDAHALPWELYRAVRADLRELARRVRSGEVAPDVRAVWAETLVYTSMTRLGFVIRPGPPTLRTPFARLYLLALMAVYGPPGLHTRRTDHYRLGEAWIGIGDLLDRYG